MPPTAAQTLQRTWKMTVISEHTTSGITIVRRLTQCMDTYFCERCQELDCFEHPGFCLLAVGGYGRKELCLLSDIDILMIHKDGRETAIAKDFFTPLWDLGFTLGHGVMTSSQCLDLAKTDNTFQTSLLDARFVAGSRQVSEAILTRIEA
ncbi:MAG: DUF294 nucleotidyltransferase-like domain-containing protein, partial [Desulfoplanes sp.]|nr:DUF294 nucleotidyltransferase-like domain-containing protein [Desulfoplanes sp.]